jgi:hypothetical protein
MRADPKNLPNDLTKPWPWPGYAGFALQDWSTAYTEKGEVYDFVSKHGITGFVTVAGDSQDDISLDWITFCLRCLDWQVRLL